MPFFHANDVLWSEWQFLLGKYNSLSSLCVAVGYLEVWQAEISDISPERQSESIYWAVHHLAD